MKDKKSVGINEVLKSLMQALFDVYTKRLLESLEKNRHLESSFTGFLLQFERIVFYIGKTHLAIEYFGSERLNGIKMSQNVKVSLYDFAEFNGNFIEQIIGFTYNSTSSIKIPFIPFMEELILPTNKGLDKLLELKWNFSAQNSIIGFNTGNFYIPEGKFCRIVNSLFFDADSNGLKTRHIKWLDFLPIEDVDEENIKVGFNVLNNLIENDLMYEYPLTSKYDYKYSKLPIINRFVEMIGNSQTSEPTITLFLSKPEHKFILSMAFFAKEIYAELHCKWQSEDKESIKPDFFVLKPDGYADIVEFKLPYLKGKVITGKKNRETFSSEINSYISQTRNYKSYFDDPNNRKWFEEKYKFKVHHPKRILVVGRRWDFDRDEWKDIISDYKDIEIMTYEDLIDGVTAQFYI